MSINRWIDKEVVHIYNGIFLSHQEKQTKSFIEMWWTENLSYRVKLSEREKQISYINTYVVKAMAFPVLMYRCESWTVKKTECRRIDASELWCWRRFLRVPWTARRSNQSLLKEISPEYSLEGLMLKLKFQYFGQLMQRANSLEKTLMLGKIEGKRRRGQ